MIIIRVLFWFAGAGLITYGVFQFDPRLACVVAGVVLLIESRDGLPDYRGQDVDSGS